MKPSLVLLSEPEGAAASEEYRCPPFWMSAPIFRGDAAQAPGLGEENNRLRGALELKDSKWPRAVVAHVAGRDPQRWFQEIVLDKGKDEGLEIDAPVLAVVEGREALVGRIVEVSAHVSKVMLLQDSLSEVAATVPGDQRRRRSRGRDQRARTYAQVPGPGKPGETGGPGGDLRLGEGFPPGIPIGWVEGLEPDPRQLFCRRNYGRPPGPRSGSSWYPRIVMSDA